MARRKGKHLMQGKHVDRQLNSRLQSSGSQRGLVSPLWAFVLHGVSMAGARKKKGQDFLIQGPWELPKLATSLLAPISAPQAWNSYTIAFSLSHTSVFCVFLKPCMVTQAPLVSPSNLQPLRGMACFSGSYSSSQRGNQIFK